MITLLHQATEIVEVTGSIHLCRDPDDDLVIETALKGRAEVLVSRDDDLKGESNLVANLRARGVEVLSVRRFLARLDAAGT